LGPPLERAARTTTSSAGGTTAAAYSTKQILPVRFGSLSLNLNRPTLVDTHMRPDQWVHRYGLVGMDVFMGRVLYLHRSEKILGLSPTAQLSEWPKNARARFTVTTPNGQSELDERVLDVDVGYVLMEMKLTGRTAQTLRLRFVDNWNNRGTWFFTRPASQIQVGEGAFRELDKKMWRALLGVESVNFKSVPGKVSISVEEQQLEGRRIGCNRVTLPAVVGEKQEPATMRLLECPSEPWRIQEVEVRTTKESVFELRRVGLGNQT
jgi:hypothetical protein